MQESQDQFREAMLQKDGNGMTYWNNRVHFVMGDMADNLYLKPSYERLLVDHAWISQTFYSSRLENFERVLETAAGHHDSMLSCIRAGDAEAQSCAGKSIALGRSFKC